MWASTDSLLELKVSNRPCELGIGRARTRFSEKWKKDPGTFNTLTWNEAVRNEEAHERGVLGRRAARPARSPRVPPEKII